MFIILSARYFNRTFFRKVIYIRDVLRLGTILKVKCFLQRLCKVFGQAYTPQLINFIGSLGRAPLYVRFEQPLHRFQFVVETILEIIW